MVIVQLLQQGPIFLKCPGQPPRFLDAGGECGRVRLGFQPVQPDLLTRRQVRGLPQQVLRAIQIQIAECVIAAKVQDVRPSPAVRTALNTPQKLTQTRLALFSGSFHVKQPWHPSRQEVFIFQARDCLARSHPTVALPVDAEENVTLLKVGPVKAARRVRTRAKLEHHWCQLEPFDRTVHGLAFLGQLSKSRTDKDPEPLIRRSNRRLFQPPSPAVGPEADHQAPLGVRCNLARRMDCS